jgi:hypothetical protein
MLYFLFLFLFLSVQARVNTTMHLIQWGQACIQRYPKMNLTVRNTRAEELKDAWDNVKNIWEYEFMQELGTKELLAPIASHTLCHVDCENNQVYFDTVLGLPRYGLGDAVSMSELALASALKINTR